MTQFIAHTDKPRTFSDKKGATKAIKRDLAKHLDAHGDTLYATGFEAKQTAEGRFGVVVFCDLTLSSAKKVVGPELSGYVIEPELKEEPMPKPAATAPVKKQEAKGSPRRKGYVSVAPTAPLLPCRKGSKQQAIINALATDNVWDTEMEFFPKGSAHPAVIGMGSVVGGATLEDLRKVCLKKDGVTPWDDNSIRSALYYDLKDKGYGTYTRLNDEGEPVYTLVLPQGVEAPLAPKEPKS